MVPKTFKWWPNKLFPRTLVLVVLALLLAQGVSLWILSKAHQTALRDSAHQFEVNQFVSLVQLLEQIPASMHQQAIQVWERPGRTLSFSSEPYFERATGGLARKIQNSIVSDLGPEYTEKVRVEVEVNGRRPMRRPDHFLPSSMGERGKRGERSGESFRPPILSELFMAVRLSDGQWFSGSLMARVKKPLVAMQTLVFVCSSIVLVLAVVFWQLRKITLPLRLLETAANAMGRGKTVEPLDEEGPEDVKATIQAFNQMNERTQRFLSDRTRMLAALSHDLRTPITSMRLRLELMEVGEHRDKLLMSLDEIQQMSESTLAFVHQTGDVEPNSTLDLTTLVSSVCDDLKELGKNVECNVSDKSVVLTARPIALRRALRNLIENAVAYGQSAAVSIEVSGDVWIHIDDCGDGIPEAQWQEVFEPFFRLENSRNRQTGGVGLGLSIAQQLMSAHGGRIELAHRENGFRVSMVLPRRLFVD